MFIKSSSVSFIYNAMAEAMAEAALKTEFNSKLEKCIADTFVRMRPIKVYDWTAHVFTKKNINQVQALMA